MVAQSQERQAPTFDRSAFQASAPSSNTKHGSVRSAVLGSETSKPGFDKTAWKPPAETVEEQEEQSTGIGFDRAAWSQENGNTE
jgi:hypothetical protein